VICDRPKCGRQAPAGDLYCSERCFEQDHDPTPITVRKQGGVSIFTRYTREPVILPDNPAYWRRMGRAGDVRR
jgi:hypothetical protein